MRSEESSPTAAPEGPVGTRALGRTLMDAFGKGWARGSVELLTSVYAPEAVLVETPFSTPLKGLDEIERYWREVPYNQSEVTFTTGEIYEAGPWFATEFRLAFRRKRTGEWVEARGAIFCETAGDRISEMRIYWHRSAGGRDESKP